MRIMVTVAVDETKASASAEREDYPNATPKQILDQLVANAAGTLRDELRLRRERLRAQADELDTDI